MGTHPVRTAVLALAALSSAAAASPRADPQSRSIDPPPGQQDYIAAFPRDAWTFGKLLWQGREPCTADFCEAAYNADPLFILVQKERECCGGSGYSVMILAVAKGCAATGYYLFFSQQVRGWSQTERLALISRHVAQLAAQMRITCRLPSGVPVPTAALAKLFA